MIQIPNNLTAPENINNYSVKPDTTTAPVHDTYNMTVQDNSYSNNILGYGELGNIQLSAAYSVNSSVNNPVVTITLKSNNETEIVDININSVNPENATTIEMFAFCKYTESKLPDSPMFFAAWEKLNQFQEIAEKNGRFEPAYNITDCKNSKKDWRLMVDSVNKISMAEWDYDKLLDGKKLEGIFSGDIDKCSEKFPTCASSLHDDPEIVEEAGICNLPGHIDLMFSSTRELVCIDQASRVILWSLSLSKEEANLSQSFWSLPDVETYKPYMADINFWKSYFDGSLDLDKLDEFNKLVEDKSKNNSFNEGCPDEVKQAWNKAEELSGFNAFGIFADGKIEYFSEYLKQMLINFLLGTDTNVLGSTKEQAEEFAKTAIDNIEHGDYNTYYTKIKNKEKKFWKDFLANL